MGARRAQMAFKEPSEFNESCLHARVPHLRLGPHLNFGFSSHLQVSPASLSAQELFPAPLVTPSTGIGASPTLGNLFFSLPFAPFLLFIFFIDSFYYDERFKTFSTLTASMCTIQ